MSARSKAIRDGLIAVVGLALFVALQLWISWVTEWAPDPTQFRRIISALILVGFVLLLVLFFTLVAIWRADWYAHRPRSPLHFPTIALAGALAWYFGIGAISAVDVFYKPREPWPLLRDPGIQLIGAGLVLGIVAAIAWLLYEIVYGRSTEPRSP